MEISSGDLDNLDPEIIDGFSILKDATATAMYGTRGANGVMIITTKSGRNIDKPIINFRVEGQITSPTSKPKFVDGATYMDLFNESLLNGGSTESPYSAEEIAGTRAGLNPYAYPNVNWYDELFKDQAFNQNFNVNIRGGGKRVDYFSSVTVNHETGMIKNRSKDFFSYNNNINVMRYSFQNNINAYLGKDSRLSLRLNVQLRKTKQPNISMNDLFAGAINTSPVEAPVYFPDDGVTTHIKWGVNDRLKPGQQQNPVAQLASGYQDNFRSTVVAALEFEQKLNFITEGLRFKALASFKNWSSTTNSASAGWNKYHLQDFSVDDNGVYSFVTRLQNESGGEVSTDLKPGVANSGDRRFYFQAARMIEKGISRLGRPINDVQAAIENVGNIEVAKLEKGLPVMATISGGAPMLGFLGTVTGMVRAFYEMANAGSGNIDITLLSGGIYEAMITTVGGLIVGIIAMFAYNYLVMLVDRVVNKMESRTMEFMDLLNELAQK